jgi:2-deoxy-D-gluconate 3-dehydrogenase
MALGLRDAGAAVAICGRNKEKNAAAQKLLGDGALVVEADITDERAVQAMIGAVVARFARLDVLVNNAGNFRGGIAVDLSLDDWNAVIGAHLTGPFLCSKHAAKRMIEQGNGGKIINVSSIYSLFGPNDFSDYAAAKSGLNGLTRALAVELAHHDIQVNAILPGFYDTEMSAGIPDWLRQQIIDKTPGRRFGRPDELTGATVFLASRASDWVTGVCLPVDGGYSIKDRLI